jgi:hypothetical protein
MTPPLMNKLGEYIGPVEGQFLRPFVADGDPAKCAVVLLGYNPANRIPANEISPDRFCELLVSREAFEKFYRNLRAKRKQAEGKTGFRSESPTRRRLRKVREEFRGYDVVEMNLNALATDNLRQLRRSSPHAFKAGLEAAKWAASVIRPKLVIAFGAEIQIPDTVAEICDFSVSGKVKSIHERVDFYDQANWNQKPVQVAHITNHLAARRVTDDLFSEIGRTIRDHFERSERTIAIIARREDVPAATSYKYAEVHVPSLDNSWNEFFLQYFVPYGDGAQESRTAYRLRTDPRRLFKLEPREMPTSISFMTTNFQVNAQMLCEQLQRQGFKVCVKPRYVEVEIKSFDKAKQSLKVFVMTLPPDLRIQIPA